MSGNRIHVVARLRPEPNSRSPHGFDYRGLMVNLALLGQMFGDYRILLGHERQVQTTESAQAFLSYATQDATIDMREYRRE